MHPQKYIRRLAASSSSGPEEVEEERLKHRGLDTGTGREGCGVRGNEGACINGNSDIQIEARIYQDGEGIGAIGPRKKCLGNSRHTLPSMNSGAAYGTVTTERCSNSGKRAMAIRARGQCANHNHVRHC